METEATVSRFHVPKIVRGISDTLTEIQFSGKGDGMGGGGEGAGGGVSGNARWERL